MKLIKQGEYKSKTCFECAKPAYFRSTYLPLFACQEHGEQLVAKERKQRVQDSHMSEADYQSWGRL